MRRKRAFAFVLVIYLVCILWGMHASTEGEAAKLRLNNYVVDFKEDQGSVVIDDVYYVPVRKVGELCHFDVDWKDGFAIIRNAETEYRIAPNSYVAYKNGKEETLFGRSYIMNDRILITENDAKTIFELYDDLDHPEGEKAFHQNFKYNDDGFYNLNTTFIGDAKSERGFAWEAELDYSDMILQYKKADEPEEMLLDIIPVCEKNAVAWANNKTYEEVPLSVYDAGNYKESYSYATMHDYRLFYKAELKGLLPGTTYTYRIGSKSKNDFSEYYTFSTEPETVTSFSIIGVTDPQGRTVSEYDYYTKTLKKALEECPEPAFILNCGDFTDNAYYDDWWRYFFESSKGTCEGIPLMTVIGNHEERGEGAKFYNYHFNNPQNAKGLADSFIPQEQTDKTALACIRNLDNTVYSFDYGNAHFAVINSGSDWGNATELLMLQKEWLRDDLNSSNKKWKILATHRGIYVEKVRNLAPKEIFLDVIDECGVDLVVEGHDHTYMRTHKMKNDQVSEDGIYYALIGSAALKRYDATDMHDWVEVVKPLPEELPSYVILSFDEDKISYVAKLIDGTVLDHFEIYDK